MKFNRKIRGRYPLWANTLTMLGVVDDHHIDISGTWGTGITGAAIALGDYSNAIAFGEVSEHVIGQCIHISGSTDDDSNIIPLHVKFTTTGDSGTNAVAQAVYGRIDIKHDLTDSYAIRGAVTIDGAVGSEIPEVNQVYGVFATLETAACNMAETGNIAGIGVMVHGTEDITGTGSPFYGKVSGIRINWRETNAMTVDTCGIYLGVQAGSKLDTGYRVNASGTLTSAFHSENTTSTPTNVLAVVGAHTNLFALPAAGTAPVVAAATGAGVAAEGSVVITIDGTPKYLQYFAATA